MFKSVNNGKLPTKGTKYSACVDVYANEDVVIGAGETVLVPLGVCIDIKFINFNKCPFCGSYEIYQDRIAGHYCDECGVQLDDEETISKFLNSHYLQLMLRSSLSKHLIIANGVGIIDLDYQDEIKMIIHKPMTFFDVMLKVFTFGIVDISKIIKKGDKIGQIMLCEHKSYLFGIESSVERDGGFGSTGT